MVKDTPASRTTESYDSFWGLNIVTVPTTTASAPDAPPPPAADAYNEFVNLAEEAMVTPPVLRK